MADLTRLQVSIGLRRGGPIRLVGLKKGRTLQVNIGLKKDRTLQVSIGLKKGRPLQVIIGLKKGRTSQVIIVLKKSPSVVVYGPNGFFACK